MVRRSSHGAVALGGLVERQGQVEDHAGLDLAVASQINELGQEAAHRGGSAVQVHVGEEQLLVAGQLDTVGTPTMPTKPPGRVERRAWVIDWLVPTHSSTAPTP
jgi:hypothetical protein